MRRRFTTAVFTSLFLFAVFPGTSYPQALQEVNIAYSAISPFQVIIKVAEDSGSFAKNGLRVKTIFIEGGSRAAQALVAGSVPFVLGDGVSAVAGRLGGADSTILLGLVNTFPYDLVTAPDIKDVASLRGKKIAISRFGSATDVATRVALQKVGLNPEKDVTILQIGAQSARFAALTSGGVQAAVITPPFTLTVRKLGFHILLDMVEMGLPTSVTAVLTTDSVIRKDPQLVERVVKSFVDAIHFYKTRKKESLAILKKYLGYTNDDEIEEAYKEAGLKLIADKPYPTPEGIQSLLNDQEKKNPQAKNHRPEEFVNTSFLEKLDRSGYIDQLYRSR